MLEMIGFIVLGGIGGVFAVSGVALIRFMVGFGGWAAFRREWYIPTGYILFGTALLYLAFYDSPISITVNT